MGNLWAVSYHLADTPSDVGYPIVADTYSYPTDSISTHAFGLLPRGLVFDQSSNPDRWTLI